MLLVGNLSFLHGRMNLYNGFFAGSIATGDAGAWQSPAIWARQEMGELGRLIA